MENLPIFIKQVMLSLACHNHLDFRDYDREKRESRLFSLVASNGWQIDVAVQQICDELEIDERFVSLFDYSVSQHEDTDDDLFYYIMRYVGLHTIFTMHPDVTDMFRDQMAKLLFL